MNVATRSTNGVLTKGTTDLITVNRIGNGLKFNGTNGIANGNSVSVPTYPAVQFTESSTFTISAIFKMLSFNPNGNYIFQNYQQDVSDFGTREGYNLYVDNSNLYFIETSNITTAFKVLRVIRTNIIGELLYITITKDSDIFANWKMYINGVLQTTLNTTNGTIAPITNFFNFKFGGFPNLGYLGNYFSNMIWYDFKIFNKVLNSTEVEQLYFSGHQNITSLETNMLMNVDFNYKQGTVVENKPTAAISGFGDGTLINYGVTTNLGGGAWVNSLGNTINY